MHKTLKDKIGSMKNTILLPSIITASMLLFPDKLLGQVKQTFSDQKNKIVPEKVDLKNNAAYKNYHLSFATRNAPFSERKAALDRAVQDGDIQIVRRDDIAPNMTVYNYLDTEKHVVAQIGLSEKDGKGHFSFITPYRLDELIGTDTNGVVLDTYNMVLEDEHFNISPSHHSVFENKEGVMRMDSPDVPMETFEKSNIVPDDVLISEVKSLPTADLAYEPEIHPEKVPVEPVVIQSEKIKPTTSTEVVIPRSFQASNHEGHFERKSSDMIQKVLSQRNKAR